MIVVCSTVPRCRWSKQLDSARWQTGLLSGFHLDLNNMGGRRGGGGGYCNMATFSWCLNTESSPGMIVMSRMLMLLRCVVCVCVCVTEGGKDNVPAAKVQFLLQTTTITLNVSKYGFRVFKKKKRKEKKRKKIVVFWSELMCVSVPL